MGFASVGESAIKNVNVVFSGNLYYATENEDGVTGFTLNIADKYSGFKSIELENLSIHSCTVYNYSGASGKIYLKSYDKGTGDIFVANVQTAPKNNYVVSEIEIRISTT